MPFNKDANENKKISGIVGLILRNNEKQESYLKTTIKEYLFEGCYFCKRDFQPEQLSTKEIPPCEHHHSETDIELKVCSCCADRYFCKSCGDEYVGCNCPSDHVECMDCEQKYCLWCYHDYLKCGDCGGFSCCKKLMVIKINDTTDNDLIQTQECLEIVRCSKCVRYENFVNPNSIH